MTTKSLTALAALLGALGLTSAFAGTTIDGTNKFSYGANLGWMDWTGDATHGVVIGEYVCSGSLYSANVGWINLGGGAPANGIYYQNNTSTDFGVNQDGLGNLSGYAYGANIGWIAFETNGAPKIDLYSGNLSGYIWSANCGWISLSNATAYVQTDIIQRGVDSNGNGIADAWEYQNFGALVSASADPDHDGMSNLEEYLAGTNPNDSNDVLRVTSVSRGGGVIKLTTINWTSAPTRYYNVQYRTTLDTNSTWTNLTGSGFGVGNSVFNTGTYAPAEFYRIRASRPLIR
jgi:hypothetical protein